MTQHPFDRLARGVGNAAQPLQQTGGATRRRSPVARMLLCAIAGLLLATLLPGAALPRPFAAPGVTAQPATCADVIDAGSRLVQDIPGLAGGTGELCLLAYDADGVENGVLLGVSDTGSAEAAKADALAQLTAQGQNLCQIAVWRAPGVALSPDDATQLQVTCAPTFVSGDAGAAALMPQVQAAFAHAATQLAGVLGWQQDRPLRVEVYSDLPTVIAVYQRDLPALLPQQTPDGLAQTARDGASWILNNAAGHLGNTVLLNLTMAHAQTLGGTSYLAAFMYTGFAATALGTNSQGYEYWFREGFDAYLAEQIGGEASGYLALAAKDQAGGSAPSLAQVTTVASWTALANQQGGQSHLLARAYATMIYLSEQYGFPAVAQLLTANHGGSQSRFQSLLLQLTGADTAALDQAVGAWLLTTPLAARGAGPGVSAQAVLSPGGTFAELTVTFTRALACGSGVQIAAGTRATFVVTATAGGFAGTGYADNATVTFSGTVSGGTVSGTVTYSDSTRGCTSDPITVNGGAVTMTAGANNALVALPAAQAASPSGSE